jgi:hypothetical protein
LIPLFHAPAHLACRRCRHRSVLAKASRSPCGIIEPQPSPSNAVTSGDRTSSSAPQNTSCQTTSPASDHTATFSAMLPPSHVHHRRSGTILSLTAIYAGGLTFTSVVRGPAILPPA